MPRTLAHTCADALGGNRPAGVGQSARVVELGSTAMNVPAPGGLPTERRGRLVRLGPTLAWAVGLWLLVGVVAALLGIWFRRFFQPLCENMFEGWSSTSCEPPSRAGMAGYALIILGVGSLIVAPIVLSIWTEARTEGDTRKPVRRAANYGLLVAFFHMAVGAAVHVTLG